MQARQAKCWATRVHTSPTEGQRCAPHRMVPGGEASGFVAPIMLRPVGAKRHVAEAWWLMVVMAGGGGYIDCTATAAAAHKHPQL